jgi:hypothetical protein
MTARRAAIKLTNFGINPQESMREERFIRNLIIHDLEDWLKADPSVLILTLCFFTFTSLIAVQHPYDECLFRITDEELEAIGLFSVKASGHHGSMGEPSINATLKLDGDAYGRNDTLTITVTNYGSTIELGDKYYVERFDGSNWMKVTMPETWLMYSAILRHNDTFIQRVYLSIGQPRPAAPSYTGSGNLSPPVQKTKYPNI